MINPAIPVPGGFANVLSVIDDRSLTERPTFDRPYGCALALLLGGDVESLRSVVWFVWLL